MEAVESQMITPIFRFSAPPGPGGAKTEKNGVIICDSMPPGQRKTQEKPLMWLVIITLRLISAIPRVFLPGRSNRIANDHPDFPVFSPAGAGGGLKPEKRGAHLRFHAIRPAQKIKKTAHSARTCTIASD